MNEDVKIRNAFLTEASEWREYADKADHPTHRAIGLMIADAMESAAKKWKIAKTDVIDEDLINEITDEIIGAHRVALENESNDTT
jgi:hypothetical protein